MLEQLRSARSSARDQRVVSEVAEKLDRRRYGPEDLERVRNR